MGYLWELLPSMQHIFTIYPRDERGVAARVGARGINRLIALFQASLKINL